MKIPDLSGRVAIVTGSSRGIGKDIALALAEAGCDICVAAKTTEPHPLSPERFSTPAMQFKHWDAKPSQ